MRYANLNADTVVKHDLKLDFRNILNTVKEQQHKKTLII